MKQKIAEERPKLATRASSQKVLDALVPATPELVGGSADLTPSNLTFVEGMGVVAPGNYAGRYIHYGIREHGMAACANGLALHGGIIPYDGTFFIFSDYMRPAIRLAALMRQRVIHVLTHDSIGLGEDGPTHQPIEQLASLRAMPNLHVYRPGDALETAECWELAVRRVEGPSLLVLSRQAVPAMRFDASENRCARGGYVLAEAEGPRRGTIIATGTEVAIAMDAREQLAREGVAVAVVSLAVLGVVLPAGRCLPCRRAGRGAAGRDRGGLAVRLGPLARPRRRVHRHDHVRRVRAVPGRVQRFRHHRRGGGRGDSKEAELEGIQSMSVKVAINGFGRIGRLVLRAMIESGRDDLAPIAINDLGSPEANAHLFKYDSVHGRFPGEVEVSGDSMTVRYGGRVWGPIKVSAERDPSKVPYRGVDVAMECTGLFTSKESATALLGAGARKVLISAPADGVDATIVYGVNHKTITRDMTVISNASCTTNCLAPMAKVLHESFGILRGYMVTIHAYTGDQRLQDTLHKDLHRARAAAVSAIPTSTGAARAVGLVLPELKGKLDGTAIRIPTPNVSLVSLDANLAKPATVETINAAFRRASEGEMRGLMEYNTEKLVSIDFNGCPASCTFDATQTAVVDGGLIRVLGWYDNEWGFSNRMSDTAALFGSL